MVNKLDNNMIFRIVLIVLAAFVLFALINYYNSKQNSAKVEKFYQDTVQSAAARAPAPPSSPPIERAYESPLIDKKESADAAPPGKPQPAEEESNESYRAVDFSTQQVPSDCFPKDRLTAEDLLPKDAANLKWSAASPAGQGALSDVNMLSAGYQIGISTVAGTLRNANLQLRSEPPNPNVAVSPFNNSTITGDKWRRPLEINGDC